MLILLPGLLCDHRLFEPQIEVLSKKIECKVLDLTGHSSMEGLARHVLENAPDQFALAGLSMGGYVAMEILRQAPERVTRIALLNTTALADTPEATQRRKDAIAVARAGHFDKIIPGMLPNLIHPLHVERVSPLAKQMADDIGIEGFIRQQNAIMKRVDSRETLAKVNVPSIVIVGANDALTPPDRAKEMADSMNKARLVVIGSCGHLSTLEQPQAVSSALSYWLEG